MNAQELKELRAKNLGIEPTMVGKTLPTTLGGDWGGIATITGKGDVEGVYITKSGLLWELVDDLLVGYDGLKNGE